MNQGPTYARKPRSRNQVRSSSWRYGYPYLRTTLITLMNYAFVRRAYAMRSAIESAAPITPEINQGETRPERLMRLLAISQLKIVYAAIPMKNPKSAKRDNTLVRIDIFIPVL